MPRPCLSVLASHPADPCPGFVADLVLRCGRGDDAALGHLFDLFVPLVTAIVGRGDPTESSDTLVMEAFHRLWHHAPMYDVTQDAVRWVLDQCRSVPGPSVPDPSGLFQAA